MISVRDSGLIVRDLKSRNGTFLNGRKLSEPCGIGPGDELSIGDERLTIIDFVFAASEATMEAGSEDNDPATAAQREVLELSEELILRAAETDERIDVIEPVRRMIDSLVSRIDSGEFRLSRGETVRMVSVARLITRWSEDETMDRWCEDIVLRTRR